jgi:uncharacterized protein (TIGR02001 family)
MSNMKTLIAGSVLAASTVASSVAMAGASGNVGYVFDYFFRGIYQTTSSASGGLDYDFENGLAVGVWAADVDDGIEYDLYGSYSGEVSGLGYSVGYTTYNYTDDWDGTYKEVNLGLSYGPISVAYADGTYEPVGGGPDSDYSFTSVTLEHKGAYITFGDFGKDATGSYTEIGYGMDVGGFDVGVALLKNDEDLDIRSADGDGETAMTLSLSKSFDL